MKTIYLVVGAPGSGKTWVCKQLESKFDWLPHDNYIGQPTSAYVADAARLADFSDKPVLLETPFSVSQIVEPLIKRRFNVIPVFILESESVTAARYLGREGIEIPQGHLTRINTYRQRASDLNAFSGTSEQVLAYLKAKV